METKAGLLGEGLERIAALCAGEARVKGRGMMQGIDVGSGELASAITSAAFERGMIIETSGPSDEVVKVLAPLTITETELSTGLSTLEHAVRATLAPAPAAAA